MADLYEYSTPELVRLLGVRFKEYRMRCNLTQADFDAPGRFWTGGDITQRRF